MWINDYFLLQQGNKILTMDENRQVTKEEEFKTEGAAVDEWNARFKSVNEDASTRCEVISNKMLMVLKEDK